MFGLGVDFWTFHGVETPDMARNLTSLPSTGIAAPRWLSLSAFFCSTLVALLVLNLTEFLNPDWFGYQRIYEDGGSWLAEQGRDPLFLLLNSVGYMIFGANGYTAFRYVLSVYFIVFSYLLCVGRVLPFGIPCPTLLSLLTALLIFTGTRFTIQIREGIALTLVLLALRPVLLRDVMPARTWILMGCAVLIHAGTVLLLAALLLSRWGSAVRLNIVSIHSILKQFTPFAVFTGGLLAAVMVGAGGTGAAVDSLYDTYSNSTTTLFSKFIYWFVVGAANFLIAREACRTFASRAIAAKKASVFVGLLALVLLPAIYSMIVVELAADAPLVLISGTARALHMVLGLLVIMITARGGLSTSAGVFSLLLASDQLRVVYDSILSTYVDLPN